MKEKLKGHFKEVNDRKFLTSISFFMLIQPICFYFIKYLQNNYHLFETTIDTNIPFIPYFIYIYNFFYFFVFLSFYYFYCKDKKRYYQGILASMIATAICYIIYIIYPTIIVRPEINNNEMDIITAFVLKVTYYFDDPAINCFPSIHCLFCFQIILTTFIIKNINTNNKALIIIVALLIAASTLFVKQHYVYDMLSALILCMITNLIVIIFKLDNKIIKSK